MADVWKRTEPCLDQAGRPRKVTVIAEGGRVIVHAPGNTAALTTSDARRLNLDLRDAVVEVLQNQGGF